MCLYVCAYVVSFFSFRWDDEPLGSTLHQYATILATEQPKNAPKHAHNWPPNFHMLNVVNWAILICGLRCACMRSLPPHSSKRHKHSLKCSEIFPKKANIGIGIVGMRMSPSAPVWVFTLYLSLCVYICVCLWFRVCARISLCKCMRTWGSQHLTSIWVCVLWLLYPRPYSRL